VAKADVAAAKGRLDALIDAQLSQSRRVIVASFETKKWSHWSIIRGLTPTSVWLFDSDGGHRLQLKGCAMSTRPKPKGKPRVWVKIHGTFIVIGPSRSF
jgi:hypothetical protein